MTLIVYEPICCGLEHSQFNASFLETLHHAFPDQSIVFVGEELHLSHVQSQLPEWTGNAIKFKSLNIPERQLKSHKRLMQDFKNAFEVLGICKNHKSQAIILTSCRETVLICLAFTFLIARQRLAKYSIVHMEMKRITRRSHNPIRRALDFASSLSFGAKIGIQYWVLEESIRTEVLKYLPQTENHLRVLPHPIVQRSANSKTEYRSPIKLGFLGMATKRKGFDVFSRVAKKAGDYGCYKCYVIGRSNEIDTQLQSDLFAQGPFREYLPHDKYKQLTSEIHYICVFLDPVRYNLSASGTLLDALSFRKPIIALNIPIVENLFNQYGDIGFLCNDESQIDRVLEELSNNINNDRYNTQVQNIKSIVQDRSPCTLAKIIRDKIDISTNI